MNAKACSRKYLALFILLTLASPILYAQQIASCEAVNTPASSSFDFTESISRWGSTDSFDLESTPYRVRNITVNKLPIFDESNSRENNSIHRWINRVHLETKSSVILNQLLFTTGDLVNPQMLAENERLLRQRKYVGESRIRVMQKCEDVIDLEVVTREVWTLIPGFSFSTTGGDSHVSIGVREANAFGTGQRVSAFYSNDAERNSYELGFENPNIGDAHKFIKIQADDNSDGFHYLAEYSLPFYSLDARDAWNIAFESTKEMLTQYRFGKKLTEIEHKNETAELSWGFSRGLKNGMVNRFTLGLRQENHGYTSGYRLPAPNKPPEDVSLLYPFLQIESIEDNFAVAYNISQIYRTEDLSMGKRLLASIGYDPGSRTRVITTGQFSDTLLSYPKTLLQWNTDWYGRWNKENKLWEDAILNLNIDFHRGQTERRTLFMGFSATRAFNLNNGKQVTLGGSTGLRGFDSHYLNGDGSVRFTIEERFFSNYHVLQLFRVGFASFFDVGKIYGDSEYGAGRTFKNIGLGMRLAPSKSDKGRIIHIDVAYPIGSNIAGGRSAQLVVEAKASF